MRPKLMRLAAGICLLWVGLPLAAQAGQHYEYKATAVITEITVADPASTARLAAVGICTTCSTIMTSTFIIDIDTLPEPDDGNVNTDFYASAIAGTMTMTTTSGGPIVLSNFKRDNVIGVGLSQSEAAVPADPFDSLGWAGAEPVTETGGPSFLNFNSQVPSAPGEGDGKGYIMILADAVPQPDLSGSTALPTSITIGNWDVPALISDWLDTDATSGNEAVGITAGIFSFTVTPVDPPLPVPVTNPLDETYRTAGFSLGAYVNRYYALPRTYGVTFTQQFGGI